MKQIIPIIICLSLAVIFAACNAGHREPEDPNANVTGITHDKEGFTFYTFDPSVPDPSFAFRVEELTAASDQVTVDEGNNKYVYTVENGKVVKAEFALRFGDNKAAKSMYDFYEANGYTEPFSAGRVDGAYLILTFADQSPYVGQNIAAITSTVD